MRGFNQTSVLICDLLANGPIEVVMYGAGCKSPIREAAQAPSESVIRERFDSRTGRERLHHLIRDQIDDGNRSIAVVRNQRGFSVGGVGNPECLLSDSHCLLRRVKVSRIEDVDDRIHVVRRNQNRAIRRITRAERAYGVLLDNDGIDDLVGGGIDDVELRIGVINRQNVFSVR